MDSPEEMQGPLVTRVKEAAAKLKASIQDKAIISGNSLPLHQCLLFVFVAKYEVKTLNTSYANGTLLVTVESQFL